MAVKSGGNTTNPSLSVRIGQALRRYFLAGLATLFPLAVTTWIILVIFNSADRSLGRLFGFQVPGLGLVVTILIIVLVGIISIHLFGWVIVRTMEVALVRLPLIRHIYPAVKQLSQFLFGGHGGERPFRRAVLVEYPRVGLRTIGFVTNETETELLGRQQKLLTILIPQPPSPFTGPIIFVPEDDVIPLDLSVEDALKLIVSGGVVGSALRDARSRAGTP